MATRYTRTVVVYTDCNQNFTFSGEAGLAAYEAIQRGDDIRIMTSAVEETFIPNRHICYAEITYGTETYTPAQDEMCNPIP